LEARLRNFTYESELFLDIEYKIYKKKDGQETELIHSEMQEKIPIGKMPIMVKS
jgi:DNA-directed RNA polymerase beta subunit